MVFSSTRSSQSDFSKSIARQVREALPDFEFFPRRTEPDAYGASYRIARELDKTWVPRSFASWKHGWPHAKIVHPIQLAERGGPENTHLVPLPEHAEFLRDSYGYEDVHAVGLPFVYAQSRSVERIPNSLLVMPPHTLPYTEDSWDEETYVEKISNLKSHFSAIIACIHRHNIKKGQWVREFERKGIEWVPGTRVRDKHGLMRMNTLFSMFEYMTTNNIGSHLPYAAYCGCKVSIYGPFSEHRKEDFANVSKWSEYPEVLDVIVKSSSEKEVRSKFPFLFVFPNQANRHDEWAREELGEDHVRAPEAIAELLGWSLEDQLKGYADLLRNWDLWMSKDTYLLFAHRIKKRIKYNVT
ncbi:hypothetical protein [Salinibacter ruber]|uniref:hypothetical protein n=1 Tax=Salinibacter ruber TaxID=146919 RepID=UPI0021692C06|nr:hypothetical protein [Salinibacter ruber]MCS4116729.1 hypothetical protein [Salinibacter ruber]MCS4168665.1 hypothetical protein [Salinibacter ruber]MCS4185437.1 hypothetical protein [Salinibacter ruber]